jgi:hypothetical protein
MTPKELARSPFLSGTIKKAEPVLLRYSFMTKGVIHRGENDLVTPAAFKVAAVNSGSCFRVVNLVKLQDGQSALVFEKVL